MSVSFVPVRMGWLHVVSVNILQGLPHWGSGVFSACRYWTKAGKQLEVGQHIVDGVSADGYRWLGCQGCAFNASSTLLAASFPRLLVVCVWEVASGHRIRVFNSLSGGGSSPEYPTHNAFPYYPMHVTFAPWDDQLLAIGLRMSDVLLVDIRWGPMHATVRVYCPRVQAVLILMVDYHHSGLDVYAQL